MKTNNVNRLLARRLSQLIVARGKKLEGVVKTLRDKEVFLNSVKEAKEWVRSVIEEIRNAREPNPYKNSSDEEIAGEILRRICEREARNK